MGKDTPVKTEATQSGEEYREAQDVTAPPDPVATGSTSDVPIHGEKTNVLFHPTPSVSYEPMYNVIEQRATILCIAIFFAIIFFGKSFGGKLLGLIPLSICVTSGVFLWMKDLIRRGRDIEWSSEQKRGETAVVNLILIYLSFRTEYPPGGGPPLVLDNTDVDAEIKATSDRLRSAREKQDEWFRALPYTM